MSITTGLMSIVLLGGPCQGDPGQEAVLINYDIRFVETDALTWREALHAQLRPVAQRGGAPVWTVDRETFCDFAEYLQRNLRSNFVQAPRLTCEAGATGYVTRDANGLSSGQVRPLAGPMGEAEAGACQLEAEPDRCRARFTIRGRKVDRGILTCLSLEDTRVVAVHKVRVAERVETIPVEGCPGLFFDERRTTEVRVPEVIGARVEGEWLIPDREYLIVSLGVYTIPDEMGKAVVRDRLVIIDAKPVALDPEVARVADEAPRTEATSPSAPTQPIAMDRR